MKTRTMIILGIGALIALPIVTTTYGTFTSVVSAPGRVMQDALRTENIRQQYEKFHDRCATIVSYETALAAQEAILASADGKEATRTRANIAGIKTQRSRAIAQYNADANKSNVGIFQGRTLPRRIDPDNKHTICE